MSYPQSMHRAQFQALLPLGAAFTRERDSVLFAVCDAIAIELARIDARADALPFEALPITTTEMLPDWERVAGLPDNCSGVLPGTMAARRADLVSKIASVGGQSIAYYQAIAAALGFLIFIEEFRPFRAGLSHAGDELTNGDWPFTWLVRAPEVSVVEFRAGQGSAGEPLATWGNAALECRLRLLAPAHTVVIFAYGGEAYLLLEDSSPVLLEDGTYILLENPES